MAGGAAATLLLAAGMSTTIRRHDAAATAQIEHLRAKEQEITLVERLRWSGEAVVSAGRSYLITGDPALLRRLLRATSRFDEEYTALTSSTLPAFSDPFEAEVAEDASRFLTVQRALLAARQRGDAGGSLIEQFERELLPL